MSTSTISADTSPRWPQPTCEQRPWTRWWWLGSAVDPANLSRELESFHRAGIGGVEITSIYPVRDPRWPAIPYLSPAWIDRVRHVIVKANALGMQVDLPPGSGWRIGGPYITPDAAGACLQTVPSADGTIQSLTCEPNGDKVKEPGPGGAGPAFNPFSRSALQCAIDHFTPVFSDLGIRAQFHDSWEYQSDCCPEFFGTFMLRRGYDLQQHAAALCSEDEQDRELRARLRYDYQLTLAEMALENFIRPWSEWCRALNQLSRNQAHGSPGNLLDLYAAADIPETEIFGKALKDITSLRSKFASSAGHVAGRRLISSETGTWLGRHFHVTLGDLKVLADNLLASGINHIFYHGTTYSPAEADWPGWIFFATTQVNPANTLWRDLPGLNRYITRCQSILQAGEPDNDVLVYFPFHDILHDPERELGKHLKISGDWLTELAAFPVFRQLWQEGWNFDYVSDLQLERATVESGMLVAESGIKYSTLLIPPCRFMPPATLRQIVGLQQAGATVVFTAVPVDVPGLACLESRRREFHDLCRHICPTKEWAPALSAAGARRELLASLPDVLCIRRRIDGGRYYFVANQGQDPIDGWFELGTSASAVTIMDPLSGRIGAAAVDGVRSCRVHLQLRPGASLVLRTDETPVANCPEPWIYRIEHHAGFPINGEWRVEFIDGGPALPPAYSTHTLDCWTASSPEAERFAGTATYRLKFDSPGPESRWILDLGTVHASARVHLNGKDLGILIGPTFEVLLEDVQLHDNELMVEVTNTAANRVRDLDQRGSKWRDMFDRKTPIFNLVPLKLPKHAMPRFPYHREIVNYANDPPAPAGLLGPVCLLPVDD